MKRRLSKKLAALAMGAAGLTVGLSLTAPGVAFADVSSGQFVSKSGLHCGGQQRTTGSSMAGPIPIVQYSWIYYNCGNQSVRRKVDIRNWWDGQCFGIGPGQARVLKAEWYLTGSSSPFRGSIAC